MPWEADGLAWHTEQKSLAQHQNVGWTKEVLLVLLELFEDVLDFNLSYVQAAEIISGNDGYVIDATGTFYPVIRVQTNNPRYLGLKLLWPYEMDEEIESAFVADNAGAAKVEQSAEATYLCYEFHGTDEIDPHQIVGNLMMIMEEAMSEE